MSSSSADRMAPGGGGATPYNSKLNPGDTTYSGKPGEGSTAFLPSTVAPGGDLTQSVNYGPINTLNPGIIDPSQANPYANQYLQNTNTMMNDFSHSVAGGAFNPNFYGQMQAKQQDQLTSSMGNQYARMGLAGSSAEMGGMNQAIQGNQMAWLNRQQSDQMQALKGLEGLNNQGMNQLSQIQGQYSAFEDATNQDILSIINQGNQTSTANNQAGAQAAMSAAMIAAMML